MPDRLQGPRRSDRSCFPEPGSTDQVRIVRGDLATMRLAQDGFRVAKRVYIAVGDDADRAERRINDALDRFYRYFGLPSLAAMAARGTPEDCIQGLVEVVDAGAELVVLNPLFDDAEQLEWLAGGVLPEVVGRLDREPV